jgi:DNA-binding MarR family transcriptional regulator
LSKPRTSSAAKAPAAKTAIGEAGDLPMRGLVGYQLRRAHTLFALHWQLGFRADRLRVTPMQGGMLLLIEQRPGLTQAALARLMGVEGPTLLQALDRLERNGLVRRLPRPEDRRGHALHLTPLGQRAVAAVKHFVPEREADLLVDLSTAERAVLLDLLQRVVGRGQAVTAAMLAGPSPRISAQPAPRRATARTDTDFIPETGSPP